MHEARIFEQTSVGPSVIEGGPGGQAIFQRREFLLGPFAAFFFQFPFKHAVRAAGQYLPPQPTTGLLKRLQKKKNTLPDLFQPFSIGQITVTLREKTPHLFFGHDHLPVMDHIRELEALAAFQKTDIVAKHLQKPRRGLVTDPFHTSGKTAVVLRGQKILQLRVGSLHAEAGVQLAQGVFVHRGLLNVLFAQLRQHCRDIVTEHPIGREDDDVARSETVPVLVEQIGGAMKSDGRLSAAGGTLNHQQSVALITNDPVLLPLDAGHNASHLLVGLPPEKLLQHLVIDLEIGVKHILQATVDDLELTLQRHNTGDDPVLTLILGRTQLRIVKKATDRCPPVKDFYLPRGRVMESADANVDRLSFGGTGLPEIYAPEIRGIQHSLQAQFLLFVKGQAALLLSECRSRLGKLNPVFAAEHLSGSVFPHVAPLLPSASGLRPHHRARLVEQALHQLDHEGQSGGLFMPVLPFCHWH